jgi:hypothetical protein
MRQRLLKSLRIAVTAASLLVCALLIVLWVRSYCQRDYVDYPLFGRFLHVHSIQGFMIATFGEEVQFFEPGPEFRANKPIRPSWSLQSTEWSLLVAHAPHWFYLTICAAIAALPWIKWRFSLRALLIVLTLFAVFFGAIAMSL